MSSRTYAVEMPGVPIELRPVAEEEIKSLADVIEAVANKRGTPFLLQRIRLTERFQEDVNQLLLERSGSTGYSSERKNVHAVGKTLWTRSPQGDIGFSVIIDANVLGPWSLTSPRCFTTVVHELCHVLYEADHLKRLGEGEYTSVEDTRERRLNLWATLFVDEFDVDRLVDGVVRGVLGKGDGQFWSLRELEEAQGVDWVHGVLDTLDEMPQFIDENILQFQTWRIDIENLYISVAPYVRDLLIMISHTTSMYKDTDRWPEILDCVKNTAAYKRFFKEHLDILLGQLEYSVAPYVDVLRIVAGSIEGIFRNCGICFETTSEGLYVAVNSPSR